MDRKEMLQLMMNIIPGIQEAKGDILDKAEKLRQKFVSDYPASKIASLTLDQFVVGKRERSFCYRIEQELDCLGRIKGSSAAKFGIYYSADSKEYKPTKRWGRTPDSAFKKVKSAILSLLADAERSDLKSIIKNPLSPMLKGKLLYLYHPEQYTPIYSKEHLAYFIAELNLGNVYEHESEPEMQRALIAFQKSCPLVENKTTLFFMYLLYASLGKPPAKDSEGTATHDSQTLPLLQQAIDGAIFLDALTPITPPPDARGDQDKTDYEAQRKRQKRIGDRGEFLVLALEKKRLNEAGRQDLADKIFHASQESDMEGYDILSFEEDGVERPIEVKSTSYSDLTNGFYLSANELETSQKRSNYHLYLVFSATSKSPRILRMKKPTFDGNGAPFSTQPIAFHVTQKMPHSV